MTTTRTEGALPDRGPELDRLVAQRGFFAAPFDRVPDEVYATVEGEVRTSRAGAALGPASRVSQHTYFGRFPASYWQRWTAVTEVVLETTVNGTGRIHGRASDPSGSARTVTTRDVTAAQTTRIDVTVPIDRYVDGGALWAEFTTGPDDTLEIGEVRWTVAAPPVLRPTALVMCTHNRADDCLFTLDRDEVGERCNGTGKGEPGRAGCRVSER